MYQPRSLSTQPDHALQVYDEQLPIMQPRHRPAAAPGPRSGKPCSFVQQLEATAWLKPGQPTLAPLQPASAILHPNAGPQGPMQSLSQPPAPRAPGLRRESALAPLHPELLGAPRSKALLSSDGALPHRHRELDFSDRPGQQQAAEQRLQPCRSAGSYAAAPVALSEGIGASPAVITPALDRATQSSPDSGKADQPSTKRALKASAPEATSGEAAAGQITSDPGPRAGQAQLGTLQNPRSPVLAHDGLQSLASEQQTQHKALKLIPDHHEPEPDAAEHDSSVELPFTLPLIEAIISAVYPPVRFHSSHGCDYEGVQMPDQCPENKVSHGDSSCALHALTPGAVQEGQMPLEIPLLVPASYQFANQQAYQMIR